MKYNLSEILATRITNVITIPHENGFIRRLVLTDSNQILFDRLFYFESELPFFNRMLSEGEVIDTKLFKEK